MSTNSAAKVGLRPKAEHQQYVLPAYHNADVRTVLKVRSLRACGSCGGLGNEARMLMGLEFVGLEAGHHHGRCVVQRLSSDRVLAMPGTERAKITLGDVQVLGEAGIDLLRRLLDALDQSSIEALHGGWS